MEAVVNLRHCKVSCNEFEARSKKLSNINVIIIPIDTFPRALVLQCVQILFEKVAQFFQKVAYKVAKAVFG